MSNVALEGGLGTISFDGQVLEIFGFGEQRSQRVHVGQIQNIELGNGGLIGSLFTVDVGAGGMGIKMAMKLTDKDRAALQNLVKEVRAATRKGT